MALALNPTGGALSLATLPTFGTRWLAPRLGDFLSRHPEVSLNLVTRVPRFSLEAESFDAVIFYGTPDWPGAEHQKLFDEIHVACAAPELLDRHRVENFKDLDSLTLLYLENRPDAWRDWFRRAERQCRAGQRHDDGSVLDDDPGGHRGLGDSAFAGISGPGGDRDGPVEGARTSPP